MTGVRGLYERSSQQLFTNPTARRFRPIPKMQQLTMQQTADCLDDATVEQPIDAGHAIIQTGVSVRRAIRVGQRQARLRGGDQGAVTESGSPGKGTAFPGRLVRISHD